MTLRALVASLLTAGTAAAQFTSPAGYLTTEGGSNHDYILFRYTDLRWQQLDKTSVGQAPFNIQRIAFRRDAVAAANAVWGARTLDIGLFMADAVEPGAVSENMDANYKTPAVNVFVSRPVSLPDWSPAAPSNPAPFDAVIPFDTPWTYAGVDPFLWEARVTNNVTLTNYGNDFQTITGSTGTTNSGTIVGTGCIATGQTLAMALAATFKNQYTRFRAAFNVTRAPATAPAFLFIDVAPSNLPVPGLCANVIALPTLQVGIGTSDSVGTVPEFSIENIAFSASTVGVQLTSQAAALDFGQSGIPLALSNGRTNTFPAATGTPAAVTRVYGYRTSPTAIRAPSVWTGGIVVRFD